MFFPQIFATKDSKRKFAISCGKNVLYFALQIKYPYKSRENPLNPYIHQPNFNVVPLKILVDKRQGFKPSKRCI
jgi:hypothetical protein